jgi:GH3 auxin-responsive promoter
MALGHEILIRLARAVGAIHLARQRRFLKACDNPQAIQHELLFSILRRQQTTAFGQDHGFGSIHTLEDYRRQVPVAPYERLTPYIDRLARGETSALLADDKLLMFALTSGTTAARKRIPLTSRYLAAYKRAWAMWGVRAYRDHRERKMPFRPIVQMVGDPEESRTEAGIPCGNASGFTATVQSALARWMYTVPASTGKLRDSAARYYLAMRLSIGRPCALFCAANPSTLIALGRTIDTHTDALLRDLHDGTVTGFEYPAEMLAPLSRRLKPNPRRARELRKIAERNGRLTPQDIWPPETILLGAWTGGSMTPYLRQLPDYWGHAPLRDLGLIASEGRFTLPFENDTAAGVLDIHSHYFEFIEEQDIDSAKPTVLEAHELREGPNYFLIPTTMAGLYRYHLSDLVRVRGWIGRTPKVEFVGKGNRFSSLTGEKLSEHQVIRAVTGAMAETGYHVGTYTLAPTWDDRQPFYTLYLEPPTATDPATFSAAVERRLREENTEYDAKRDSRRLGPVRLHPLPPGAWTRWTTQRLKETGGSPEQFKHPCLVNDLTFNPTERGT